MKNKILSAAFVTSSFLFSCTQAASPEKKPIAPAGPPQIGECTIFPPDNPWNIEISKLPVHPMSGDYVHQTGAEAPLHPDFGSFYRGVPNGFQYVIVPQDQARVPIEFQYATESDPGPYPIPPNTPVEAREDGKGDRHILIVEKGVCKLWEVYEAYKEKNVWHGGSGAVFDLKTGKLRPEGWTSADAAGLPILPGLVRYDEVESGAIRHALRITVPRTQRGYIYPALHYASKQTAPEVPPMGVRFRLKNSVDISGYSTRVRVILQALKTYGAFVADNGSAWFLSGVHDPRWSDRELRQLKDIHGADLEAVDTGPIRK